MNRLSRDVSSHPVVTGAAHCMLARRLRTPERSLFMRRVILVTLICGIMPGLMGLGSYIIPAQKVSAAEKTIKDITYMQELSKEVCDATSIGKSNTLIDIRDESDYTVAKLSDDKCWMTQNLRIVNYTTKADDSQTGGFTIPASNTSGFSSYDVANVYYSGNEAYGTYYTWYAATAGTGTQSKTSGDATGSICPKGWRLPTKAEYDTIAGKSGASGSKSFGGTSYTGRFLDGTTTTGSFFPLAGYYSDSSPNDDGSNGLYWSSTAADDYLVYDLDVDSSSVGTDYYLKYLGNSVRCVSANIPAADLPEVKPIIKDEKNVNIIAVKVAPTISIDTVDNMSVEVDPNYIAHGNISATISANTTYKVYLSTKETSLIEQHDTEKTLPNIPTTSDTNPVQPNKSAWGITNEPIINPESKTESHTYIGITTNPTEYPSTSSYNPDTLKTTYTYGVGVSVAPNLPVGTYSTTVTITAVNN